MPDNDTAYIKHGTLAIDLGTVTGWAFDCPTEKDLGGRISFQPKRNAHKGQRYSNFDDWLAKLLDTLRPSEVTYEQVMAHSGTYAAHVYGGLQACLCKNAFERRLPIRTYTPTQIKKAATGSGKAKKPEMVRSCIERLGVNPADDNEADARWLLFLANEKRDG